jgi:hypothetical protein
MPSFRNAVSGPAAKAFAAAACIAALLAGCNTDPDSPPGPAGRWEATFTVPAKASGPMNLVRLDVQLGADRKSVYSSFWNGLYASGFEGGWALEHDSVLIVTATRCYKGDSTGTQSANDCAEDLPAGFLEMGWDGATVFQSQAGRKIIFHRKTE